MSQKSQVVTLYGNLGKDPETRTLQPSSGTYGHYDPIIDEIVELPYTREAREFLIFSLAVQKKGMTEPRWIPCVDWESLCHLYRKGDRLRLTGYFQTRTYTDKHQQQKQIRQFVVQTANLEKQKIRSEAA